MAGKKLVRKSDKAGKPLKKPTLKPGPKEVTFIDDDNGLNGTTAVGYIIRGIEAGELDDHIRDIARACFQRRGALKGDAGTTTTDTNRVPNPTYDSPPPAPPAPTVQRHYNGVVSTNHPPLYANLSAYSLEPVGKGQRAPADAVFKFRGKRYWRSDVIGRIIPAGEIQGLPKAMMECDLKVQGVGSTNGLLVVTLDSKPRSRQGRFQDAWAEQTPLRLSRAATDQLVKAV